MSDQQQHAVNGLHVYCRLRDVCVPKILARPLARCWERLIHRLLYRGRS
ncbi:hypothetical protein [Desulfolutivibrio sulfodismutans]|nr:hypothetical protein [Desulfolutivibrio sulfodismutans]